MRTAGEDFEHRFVSLKDRFQAKRRPVAEPRVERERGKAAGGYPAVGGGAASVAVRPRLVQAELCRRWADAQTSPTAALALPLSGSERCSGERWYGGHHPGLALPPVRHGVSASSDSIPSGCILK
jgi:hypothetical protein